MMTVMNCLSSYISVQATLFLQVQLKAIDGAGLESSDLAEVTVVVRHNVHAPEFPDERYEVDVDEDANVGLNVIKLEAEDKDTEVRTEELPFLMYMLYFAPYFHSYKQKD